MKFNYANIMSNSKKRNTFYVLSITDGIILLFCVFCIEDILEGLVIFITTSVLLDFIVWEIVGISSKCPQCGDTFALRKIGSQVISTCQTTTKVTNNIKDKKGNIIGTYDQIVPATRREHLDTYKCVYCKKTIYQKRNSITPN